MAINPSFFLFQGLQNFNNTPNSTQEPCWHIFSQPGADATDTAVLKKYFECRNDTAFLEVFNDLNTSLNTVKNQELPILIIIMGFFVLMSIFGGIGNGLVVYTVCRNKHMRTARNVFITNLAISDFILCLFTQPLNVVRCLHSYVNWELGTILCKVVNMFTGLNMFVSTLSITAIALDRFQAIVYPTRTAMNTTTAAIALACIWQIAAAMSSPLLIFANIARNKIYETERILCSEKTSEIYMKHAKAAYSLATLIAQYLVPLVIVSVAYFRIYLRLQHRLRNIKSARGSASLTEHQHARQIEEKRKQRKANLLLVSISVIFALSWLPITLVNIIQDFNLLKIKEEMKQGFIKLKFESTNKEAQDSTFKIFALQSIPLLIVLSSACINPVLYGWLNDNFRTEFMKILCLGKFAKQAEAENAELRSRIASRRQERLDENTNNNGHNIPLILFTKEESVVANGKHGPSENDNVSSVGQAEDEDINVDIEVHYSNPSPNNSHYANDEIVEV